MTSPTPPSPLVQVQPAMQLTLYIVVICLGAAVFVWVLGIPERKRREVFCHREEYDFGIWYDTHYAGSGISRDVALGVAEALALEISCSPTQLFPTDQIQGNLSLNHYGPANLWDSFELADEAFEDLLRKMGISSPLDNTNWQTLDDVIRAVDASAKSRPAAPATN